MAPSSKQASLLLQEKYAFPKYATHCRRERCVSTHLTSVRGDKSWGEYLRCRSVYCTVTTEQCECTNAIVRNGWSGGTRAVCKHKRNFPPTEIGETPALRWGCMFVGVLNPWIGCMRCGDVKPIERVYVCGVLGRNPLRGGEGGWVCIYGVLGTWALWSDWQLSAS